MVEVDAPEGGEVDDFDRSEVMTTEVVEDSGLRAVGDVAGAFAGGGVTGTCVLGTEAGGGVPAAEDGFSATEGALTAGESEWW